MLLESLIKLKIIYLLHFLRVSAYSILFYNIKGNHSKENLKTLFIAKGEASERKSISSYNGGCSFPTAIYNFALRLSEQFDRVIFYKEI